MKRIPWLLVLLMLALPLGAWAADDFQYWSQYNAKVFDGKKLDFVTAGEVRIKEDVTKLGVYSFSEKLIYEYSQNLMLGLNYTYYNTRTTGPEAVADDFKFHHRIEGEFTPNYRFKNGIKLSMRNRLEYRWIEGQGSNNTRYRQRYTIELPAKEGAFFKSYYSSVEGFYSSPTNTWNEAWFVPAGFNIPLNKNVVFTPYYMIQYQKGAVDWASNQIIGTSWAFAF